MGGTKSPVTVIHIPVHCRSFKYAERVNTWEISFTSCQHKYHKTKSKKKK